MDLLMLVLTLLFCTTIEAKKKFFKTGLSDDNENTLTSSEENSSQIVALLILDQNKNLNEALSEESDDSFSVWKPKIMDVPWKSNPRPDHTDTDSSGDSNSDEYKDTSESDTDSDSNYYHEYATDTDDRLNLAAFVNEESAVLRKRWKSCRKQAAKVCREACEVSYKNACDAYKCKSKLKKEMKKECKRNCKDFFSNS